MNRTKVKMFYQLIPKLWCLVSCLEIYGLVVLCIIVTSVYHYILLQQSDTTFTPPHGVDVVVDKNFIKILYWP